MPAPILCLASPSPTIPLCLSPQGSAETNLQTLMCTVHCPEYLSNTDVGSHFLSFSSQLGPMGETLSPQGLSFHRVRWGLVVTWPHSLLALHLPSAGTFLPKNPLLPGPHLEVSGHWPPRGLPIFPWQPSQYALATNLHTSPDWPHLTAAPQSSLALVPSLEQGWDTEGAQGLCVR